MAPFSDELIAFGRESGQGGVDQHIVGVPVPIGFPAEHLHSCFPFGSIQRGLADDHRKLDAVFAVDAGQDVLDFLAQFQITDEGFAVEDRLHHPQSEGAQQPQLDARGRLARPLRLARSEPVNEIAVPPRLVHPQQVHPVGAVKVEVRDAVFFPEPREDRLVIRQQALPVLGLQRGAQTLITENDLLQGSQGIGLFRHRFSQSVRNVLQKMPVELIQLALVEDQQNSDETDDHQQQHARQRDQQTALDGSGRQR